jgi:DNA processing protein
VIAALADVTIVVEASARSGALHTAVAAARLGRRVVAWAGSPGCEALIAGGAGVIAGDDDVDAVLAGATSRRAVARPDAGSDAARVLDALDDRAARDIEELAARTGLPVRAVGRAVTDLELAGLVRLAAGQHYVRSPLAATSPN